jgi:hypothetical protein
MEWLDKLTQHTLFPGQYIYKVEPIFEEYDIRKLRVVDVTFNLIGLANFTYQTLNRTEYGIWERSRIHYHEQAFFHSVQDAIAWCQKQGRKFTIYDPEEY